MKWFECIGCYKVGTKKKKREWKKKSFSIALLSFFLFIEIEEQSSKSKSLVQSNIQIFNNHLWSIMIMTWTWTMLKKWCSRLHAIETTNDLAFEGYLKEYDVYQIFKLLMNFEYKKRKRWPRYLAYLNKTINSSFFFLLGKLHSMYDEGKNALITVKKKNERIQSCCAYLLVKNRVGFTE